MTPIELMNRNEWVLVSLKTGTGPGILRLRTPILRPGDGISHPTLVQVLWAYTDEGTAAMPSNSDSDRMETFENRLCAAWEEQDGLAVLVAVLTYDGARQWLFYTHDVDSCVSRLNAMPQEAERYPIELTSRADPDWACLRDEVLCNVEVPEA